MSVPTNNQPYFQLPPLTLTPTLSFFLWVTLSYEIVPGFKYINPIFIILLGLPLIYLITPKVTDLIFANKKIVFGPCPSCEAENRVYFGDILGVEGFKDLAECKCNNCKIQFNVQRDTLRASTLGK